MKDVGLGLVLLCKTWTLGQHIIALCLLRLPIERQLQCECGSEDSAEWANGIPHELLLDLVPELLESYSFITYSSFSVSYLSCSNVILSMSSSYLQGL